jgi:hypothetical protein
MEVDYGSYKLCMKLFVGINNATVQNFENILEKFCEARICSGVSYRQK